MKDVTQSSQDWEDFWYNSPTNSPYIVMTNQTKDTAVPITLTENEYNLVVYCIEQQMIEFNKEEYEDSASIIKKLSQITESK